MSRPMGPRPKKSLLRRPNQPALRPCCSPRSSSKGLDPARTHSLLSSVHLAVATATHALTRTVLGLIASLASRGPVHGRVIDEARVLHGLVETTAGRFGFVNREFPA